jgi:hypothetical protein
MLKGHFPALKDMGVGQDMHTIYKVVEALLVIHNLCIDLNDHPEDILAYDPTDDTTEENDDSDARHG